MARALALLLLLTGLARAENPPPAPAIDLVIIGVTDDLYSLYGHTALLVRTDPKAPIENAELFNFGVTSFSGKHYIRDFITGRVEFWGDERPWGRQLEAWKKHDRTVTRYPVQLSDDARRRLVARLRLAISPAYTRYIYDTFRENCATRPRDLLDEFSGGAVFAISGEAPSGLSYRDDVRIAFANLPGVLLATEIFPGPDLDRPRTRWEMSYRPEYLEQVMREVRLADGTPLLGEAIVEHQRRGPDPRDGWPQIGQAILLLLAMLLGLAAWRAPNWPARRRGALLTVWLLLSGVISVTLVGVGLSTDWPDFQRNSLMFALPPTDLLLIWGAVRLIILRRGAGLYLQGYLTLRLWTTGGLLALTPFIDALDGPLAPRFVAVVGLLFMRRAFGQRDSVEEMSQRPRRLLGTRTGEFKALAGRRRAYLQGDDG